MTAPRRLLKQNLRRSVFLEEHPEGARLVKRFHSETALRRLADPWRAMREARRLRAARAAGLPVPRVLGVTRVSGRGADEGLDAPRTDVGSGHAAGGGDAGPRDAGRGDASPRRSDPGAPGLGAPGLGAAAREAAAPRSATELTLEWIDGAEDLGAALARGALDAAARGDTRGASAGPLARRLGELLAAAHAAGLRHRDAHVGNVVLDRDGRPWLVDLAAARLGAPLTEAERERDLVRLGSDLRESTHPLFRMHIVAAWRRATARLAARDEADDADGADGAGGAAATRSATAHNPPAARRALRARLAALEAMIRAARRDDVARRVPVHRRTSSRTLAQDGAVTRRVAPPAEGERTLVVAGEAAGRVYDAAVRCELHGIPAARPWRLTLTPPEHAVLVVRAAAGAHATRPARALGALAGVLLDRGLVPTDAAGAPCLPRPAALLPGDPDGPSEGPSSEPFRGPCVGPLVLGGVDGVEGLLGLAAREPLALAAWLRSASTACAAGAAWAAALRGRGARATFVAAALREWRGTRAEREAVRRTLCAPTPNAAPHEHPAHLAPRAVPPAPIGAAPRATPLRRRVRARLIAAAVRCAAPVPTPVVAALAGRGAALAAHGRHGALARENVARVLGATLDDAAQAALLAATARFAGRQLAEWLRLARPCAPDGPHARRGAWIDELVALDASIARLDEVLARGRGAIVVTAHIGNWELLCARLRRRGHVGAVVGRVRHGDPSHRWLTDMRRAYGVETIPQDTSARRALAVLRDGGIVGLLTDLPSKRLEQVQLPFLGHAAATPTAPAAFARAARAPLVPIRCVADDRGRGGYRLTVEPPLELAAAMPREDAARDLLTRLNDVYSRWILATPEQWAWHQRRW